MSYHQIPFKVINGWKPAPGNLPNTIFDQIKSYLDELNGGNVYQDGKSLMAPGNLSNILTHNISPDVRY